MTNIVKLPFSNTSGNTPVSLVDGQIAINQASGSLFYRNSAGAVTQFTSAASLADGYVYDCGEYSAIAPSPPVTVSGVSGSGQAVLSWGAPILPGGASITDYTVQYSSGSGYTTFSRAASTALTATVTGLTNGTAYTFRVSATNSAGTSAYSTVSSSVTPSVSGPLLTITRDNGISTFTVSGGGGNTFTRVAGHSIGGLDGLSHYSWTASATAMVTFSFSYSDDDGGGNNWSITRTSGVSTTTEASGTNSGGASSVPVSVISGDILRVIAGGDQSQQYISNVSVSAA